MNITIKTKILERTDWLDDLITKKMAGIAKLVKTVQESSELLVEVEKETTHHRKGDIFRAEAMINLPGKKLMAKSHGDDLNGVITEVRNELEREIRKHKAKTIELPRRKYRKVKRQTF